jgi:hypothetical protein
LENTGDTCLKQVSKIAHADICRLITNKNPKNAILRRFLDESVFSGNSAAAAVVYKWRCSEPSSLLTF